MTTAAERAAQGLLGVTLALVGTLFVCRGATNMDEMTLVHDGLRVLRGEVIYRDFFQLLPPGTAWLAAAAQGLVGPGVLGPRLVQEAGLVGAGFVLWHAARRLGVGPWLALAPALAPMVALQRFLPTYGHHWLVVPVAAGALALGARATAEGRPRDWAAAGALAAGSLLFLQSDGVVITAALGGAWGIAAIARGEAPRAALRALAALAGGGLAVLAAALAPLALSGALGAALWNVWVWPFKQYRVPGGVNDIAFASDLYVNVSPFVDFWNLPFFYVKVAHFLLLFGLMLGLAALAAAWLAGLGWRRARTGPGLGPREAASLPWALATIGLLLVSTRGRADVIHVAFYAWPALLLGAAAAAALARRLTAPELAIARALPAAAVWGFVASGVLMGVGDRHRDPAVWQLGSPDAVIAASPAVAWLRAHARPADRLMAFPLVGYLGLYAVPAVGRWTFIMAPGYGYNDAAEYAGFLAEIQALRPRFVVFAPVGPLAAERPGYLPTPLAGYRLAATLDQGGFGTPRPAEIFERVEARP